MITQYDKAIAAFLTSLIGVLAAFNLNLPWLSPATIAAVTPFVAMIVTWLVPNVPPPASPSSTAGPGA